MHTTFKANSALGYVPLPNASDGLPPLSLTPLCKHGMRDDCPVDQCRTRAQQANSSVIYSSGPVLAVPGNPTPTNISFPQGRQSGTHGEGQSETRISQYTNPTTLHPPPIDEASAAMLARASSGGATSEMELEKAVDGLSFYQGFLNSQLTAQKAKIYAMSSQFRIPVPDLDSNSLYFSRLPFMVPPVAEHVPATAKTSTMTPTNNGTFVADENVPLAAPPAPLLPPAQHVPGFYQTQTQVAPLTVQNTSGLAGSAASRLTRQPPFDQHFNAVSRAGTVSKQAHTTSTAPKKDDMAYKTAPCRHFALNEGWCPWGDECGFIHDPKLEWVPTSERNSGRSTPSSTTVIGSKPAQPDKTAETNSAHCWGYIQGICPHMERCKYFHPENIIPYIKYTPCLTWPRCGYPAQHCPLKHPQVDKLNTQEGNQRPLSTTMVVPTVPQLKENIAPRAETYPHTRVPPHPSLNIAMPSPRPATEGSVIPYDEVYASAKLHHHPTAPSPETFTPVVARPTVRMRRPSEDLARPQDGAQAATPGPCGLGMGSNHGRTRSVSIAVQKLDAELAGMAPRVRVKVDARGHGRGKSMNL